FVPREQNGQLPTRPPKIDGIIRIPSDSPRIFQTETDIENQIMNITIERIAHNDMGDRLSSKE
uniref:DNA damage-regulated autophagy modulator protein 2 n=1 Tax=Parascaris univalens TaxID=6257 RepID=A0A914ZEQ7_PARUN